MIAENKVRYFETELGYIKNSQVKLFAEEAIKTLPDYFFDVPASSSGKYHSQYALGNGGLGKHVKACARFAVECFRLEWYSNFTEDEKDLIIVALLLHDGAKSGVPQQENTQFDHPIIICNYLRKQENLKNIISEQYFNFVMDGILSHMGSWNVNKSGLAIMPKPETKAQKLIHFIDYVCSRRIFEVNFDVEVKRD
jgi:hypothetical protein